MGHFRAGRITLLFTDIEGSTRLLHELGADYTGLLGQHHDAVRAALAAHGGREIRIQGDSFFAVFTEAQPAVAAAVDAQRSLVELGLRVRMGSTPAMSSWPPTTTSGWTQHFDDENRNPPMAR
jgi:class 3 adenylate cyclase